MYAVCLDIRITKYFTVNVLMHNDGNIFKCAENSNLSVRCHENTPLKLEIQSKTMNNSNNISFHSVNSAIQKVALYETKTRLLLVGSNDRETKFRCLELDRTAGTELKFHEYPSEYDARGIRTLVGTLGQCKKISAYGVLGFIRFMESFYMILVTKRTKCGVIGKHIIYTIKDTVMIRVCEPSVKQTHPLEQRYVRMFTNIDLNSNFYFSYSYDLTRTLQHNLSAPRFIGNADIFAEEPLPDWNSYKNDRNEKSEYAIRSVSRKRFVWNAYLLKPMSVILNRDWLLEVIHGFFSQSNISIFGRSVYVCLIARRSTRFAGTRFLKRGANFAGDVANEVESEQIVVDGHRMCSFTQMRGSIPSHWSQDISKMVPKPPISLDLSDPYALTPGKHYSRLLFDFGAPIIVLNLVKKRERRRHESILTADMTTSINYLNQFLPPQHRIKYHHFDMARKSHGDNVLGSLAKFAENFVQKTGLFCKDSNSNDVSFQTGIVRVNCVDCLDRTNTAQFAIGKTALAHQLHRLGFLKAPPKLEFDSDCVTMLESLYEDHGDTLALQYGGSQLVHRIKTYRKTAAWTSQGNDFMQTLSRYYSNTFSDTEKQHSMNIFLGYFIPLENKENIPIWDLPTDYFMHNSKEDIEAEFQSPKPLTEWVSPFILKHLPNSTCDSNKIVDELIRVHSRDLEMIDYYSSYHIPYRWTSFEENIAFTISLMARCFTPTFRTNFSPFVPATRRSEGRGILKNPSLTGQSSTGSTNSSSSSDEDTSSEDDSILESSTTQNIFTGTEESEPPSKRITFNMMFPPMIEVYQTSLKQPNKTDMAKYKQYVKMGTVLMSNAAMATYNPKKPLHNRHKRMVDVVSLGDYGIDNDNYKQVKPPKVKNESIEIYERYIELPDQVYNRSPSINDLNIIDKYISLRNT